MVHTRAKEVPTEVEREIDGTYPRKKSEAELEAPVREAPALRLPRYLSLAVRGWDWIPYFTRKAVYFKKHATSSPERLRDCLSRHEIELSSYQYQKAVDEPEDFMISSASELSDL